MCRRVQDWSNIIIQGRSKNLMKLEISQELKILLYRNICKLNNTYLIFYVKETDAELFMVLHRKDFQIFVGNWFCTEKNSSFNWLKNIIGQWSSRSMAYLQSKELSRATSFRYFSKNESRAIISASNRVRNGVSKWSRSSFWHA